MIKLSVYFCLLSALSVVAMKPLNITGRAGKNVTIKCSDWNVWTDVKHNVKYFCVSPCKKEEHILNQAAPGKTTYENRIELNNTGEFLFVTFTDLKMSDSKTYYCGVKRYVGDSLLAVNLTVTNVTNSSTRSSDSSDFITDMSTSHTTLNTTLPNVSATQGTRNVPYLIAGVIAITAMLMVLLMLVYKLMKQLKVKSRAGKPQEDTREAGDYDEIRRVDQTDPGCLYVNYFRHQHTELTTESCSKDDSSNSASRSGVNLKGACADSRVPDPQCDLVYSVAQRPKEQIEPTGQSESNQCEIENDSFCSLAKLPQAT
ncbi:CMRF35-like molecule 3 isoform X2 [Plectropomus leopardus]|uniref:CMRF35-like molecule 3 isoform X2 n=1 Tax=Plectropomus leopardus TaxID=160734 RepID=UPI001C4CACE1|nr:CMRF35-like molecule 3 isoform X2 [Plectropomus leopardus]